MSRIRFPMIVTCFIANPTKMEKLFQKVLREAGYIRIGENAYVHHGGEQLTAAINFGKTFFLEIKKVRDCLTLYLSDAEHAINIQICDEINELLSSEAFLE
ncbi:MAG: hypothetical protein ACTSXO_11740 [Candidatus Heimdallarchaeota archaeon]